MEAERSVVAVLGKAPVIIQRVAERRQSRVKGHHAFQRVCVVALSESASSRDTILLDPWMLLDRENGVEIYIEIAVVNLHGVDFEGVEGHFVAGRLLGFGKKLADKLGDVDFHLLRELPVEERDEKDV